MSTILVIEDSKSNAQLIKIALESTGYEVLCAFNGQDGIAIAEEHHPDLVIVDLRLPGSQFDGWTLLRMFREHVSFNQVPLIVTSVEISPDDRARAYDAGCDVYFAKPFNIRALREQIIEYIGTP